MVDLAAVSGAIDTVTSSWSPWIFLIPGILIGLFTGALPGFGAGIAMIVLLPATLFMDFLTSIIFLTSIFTGGAFGSAIPAILINVPGGPSSVATTFDGFPMTQAGQHNEALGLAIASSCFGTVISYLLLFFFIDPISAGLLKLGPTEMFVVILWGVTLIGSLRGEDMSRGLLAGIFGILLGTVGFSLHGHERGTLGISYLLDGIPVLPSLVALFAATEMFAMSNSKFIITDELDREVSFRRVLTGMRKTFSYPLILGRGSLLGALIGAVPGVGSSIANLVSYAETSRRSANPKEFGRGTPKGVVAAESANSSSEGGSMTTLLALGIPGSGATAILLAAFAMQNVTSGPTFFIENTEIVYAIIFLNIAEVFVLFIFGLALLNLVSQIVRLPNKFLVPSVLMACVIGSYVISGSIAGPATFAVFAVLGWFMRIHGYPVAATVIGLLLGGKLEDEALRSYQITGGEMSYLLERPVTLIFLILLFATIFVPLAKTRLRAIRKR